MRGLAHHSKPIIMIGKNGITPELITAINDALLAHELIKIKFIDYKDEKKDLAADIANQCQADLCGLIGNIMILFKNNPDEEKQTIKIDQI